MGTKKTFFEIKRNDLEKIIISESEWKEVSYLDIRIWFDPTGDGKEFIPTKKGLTVRLDDLEAFRDGVITATKELLEEKPSQ